MGYADRLKSYIDTTLVVNRTVDAGRPSCLKGARHPPGRGFQHLSLRDLVEFFGRWRLYEDGCAHENPMR